MAKQSPATGSSERLKLYIGIAKDGDQLLGHTVAIGKPIPYESSPEKSSRLELHEGVDDLDSDVKTGFKRVYYQFRNAMDVYRRFIPLMLSFSRHISSTLLESEIQKFAEKNGKPLPHLDTDTTRFYELSAEFLREYRLVESKMRSATIGVLHLPEVSIIGLVSAYDAFLAQLLTEVFSRHEGMVLTEDRTLTYGELTQFTSIDDAKSSLIAKSVESIIRESHDEQFRIMERKFGIPLTKNLTVWSEFVELCERRNLLTHTGGLVSSQYIAKCRANNVDLSNVRQGQKLEIDPKYYEHSVGIIYEIGIKLCSVLWRKFAKDEMENADEALVDLGFSLITERAYAVAEAVLRFGAKELKAHSSDGIRRIMVVNLANAVKLQDRQSEADEILDECDWSACGLEYKICVEAIKGNLSSVIAKMKEIGSNGRPTKHEYRTWPVFRGLHTESQFLDAFYEVFGEPFNEPTVVSIEAEVVDKPRKSKGRKLSSPTEIVAGKSTRSRSMRTVVKAK